MRKTKSLLVVIASLIMILIQPISIFAQEGSIQIQQEYIDDGSYYEIIIESSENQRSSIKNASKTAIYKNANGESLWYAKVTANFYYDGTTSSCTSASASGGSYVSTWKILSTSSSRTGNVGSATVKAGAYLNGAYVGSITEKVLIACDKNGNIS